MQVSSFWIGMDAKTAEPCLELKTFQLVTISASKTKKGLKWIQNILIDVEKVEPVQRVCSRHWGASQWWLNCIHALKPSRQSCALWKSQPGRALLAERLPGQRGGAAKENRFPFYKDFVSYVFDSTVSPRLHKHPGVELFKLHSLVLLIYNSTASDKEKNLKCSAPFKQEESQWWQARECVTCFSTTPRCTHTHHMELGKLQNSLHTGSQLSARELNLQLPLPELGAQSTKSRTSLEHLSCKLL